LLPPSVSMVGQTRKHMVIEEAYAAVVAENAQQAERIAELEAELAIASSHVRRSPGGLVCAV
jgi:hypothetical protein